MNQVVFAKPISETAKNFKHSYLSCSIITSEHLTVLQLYQRGLPKQLAIESLPNITRAAKKRVKYVYDLAKKIGILNTYADINTNYARCSTAVFQIKGKPAPDHILYAMSELNINASDTLYIGDMDVDYEAAKRAHVNYAHALWGYGVYDDENIIKLEKITQLMDII